MLPVPSRLPGSVIRTAFGRRLMFALLAACLWGGYQGLPARPEPPGSGHSLPPPAPVPAQVLPPPCTTDCPKPPLPPAPQKAPRPATGPEAVGSFLDTITSNDAAFEVIVGQGRILTLKESLGVKGKVEPLVAIGDPSVAEF